MQNNVNAAIPPSQSSSMLWDALLHDTPCQVLVVDRDGVVHAANDLAARAFGVPGGDDLVGRRMGDLYPRPFAGERLDAVREVLETGQPIVIQGLANGSYRRTVFRPMPGDEPRVLVVCAPGRAAGLDELDGREGLQARAARAPDPGPLAGLSDRELEVLRLIAEGYTTAQIAELTSRSIKTIEWHRVSLGNKLGASNRVELARIAVRAGLVDLEAPPKALERAEDGANGVAPERSPFTGQPAADQAAS